MRKQSSPYAKIQGSIMTNTDSVICPACAHQFQAISVDHQAELAALRAPVGDIEAHVFNTFHSAQSKNEVVPVATARRLLAEKDRRITELESDKTWLRAQRDVAESKFRAQAAIKVCPICNGSGVNHAVQCVPSTKHPTGWKSEQCQCQIKEQK